MSSRLEIEITSLPGDDRFTWRVVGAKQPKGEGPRTLLPEGTKVGDQFKAEADFGLDGIDLTNITPARRQRKEATTLELISNEPSQLVTTKLAEKGRGGGRRDDRDGGRGRGRGREGDRDRGRGRGRDNRGEGGGRDDGRGRGDRPHRPAPPEVPTRPKAKRLRAGKTHRNEVLASLPDEQRPVADQLIAGGLPAVRAAIKEQNEHNKAEGRPEVKPGPLIGLAEQLQEQLRTAEWRDRRGGRGTGRRGGPTRPPFGGGGRRHGRERRGHPCPGQPAARRTEQSRRDRTDRGAEEISALIGAGRVIRALRVSSRSPKAGAPLPGDLATRLAGAVVDSVDDAMTDDRWGALLDALAFSPIRALVDLDHIPAKPSEELLGTVRAVASRLPELAKKFGVDPATAPKNPPRRRRPGGDKAKPGRKPNEARQGDRPPRDRPQRNAPGGGVPKDQAPTDQAPTEAPAADAAPPTETAPVSVADDTDTHEGVVPDATDAE